MNTRSHLVLEAVSLSPEGEFTPNPDGLTLVFAVQGGGRWVMKSAVTPLAAGEILLVNGGAGGKITAHDKGDFQFRTFSLCFENLLPLFSGNEISVLHAVTEGFKAPKIFPAAHPLAKECQSLLGAVPEQLNLNHRGHLVRIATTILAGEFSEAQTRRSGFVRAEDHMAQVFERLSPSEFIALSVGELAEKFSCSRRHLNRLFHQHFGVSVATLRMEMRLLKAMSLLRDPDAKVINVAEQCGFNHLGLFNTCFKRRFGASPGQWRKAALEPQKPKKPVRQAEASVTGCPLHTNGLCLWGIKAEGGPPAVPKPMERPGPGSRTQV